MHATPLVILSGGFLCLSIAANLLARSDDLLVASWAPASGLAFGYLLLVGTRGIPVVVAARLLGAALVGIWQQHPVALTTVAGEVAIAVWLGISAVALRRCWRPAPSYGALVWFIVFGIIAAPIGTALITISAAGAHGPDADPGMRARIVLGTATAIAALAPAVYLLTDQALTGRPLAPRVTARRRLAIITHSVAIVVVPALFLVSPASMSELMLMPVTLVPLAWLAFSPDQTRGATLLAVCSLFLGGVVTVQHGDGPAAFRLHAVMFAAAVATMFAGVGLAADARNTRAENLQSSRWRALVAATPAVVARVDPGGHWVTEAAGSQGMPFTEAVDLVDRAARVPRLVSAVASGAPATVQWRLPGPAGRRFVTHVTPLPDGGGLTVTTETTRLHSAEIALAWERSHDRETDLPNRDLLLATAGQAVAEGSRVSVILLDVDRAPWRAGLLDTDPVRLMLALSDLIRGQLDAGQLKEGHALVARVGDDQFGVLVPTDALEAREIAARMVSTLRQAPATDRVPLRVTAWAGVAELEPGSTAMQALQRAAAALHAAIEGRRQHVVVLDRLEATTSAERSRLAVEVIDAVAGGDLAVVFQPDVSLPDGRLIGVEALVRWRRPEGFATATDLFVRLAEETGAVQAVDAWVMEESLRQMGVWQREQAAADLELGLNVSALSLTDDLPDRLFEACLRHDVPPWQVRLEVTETALADASAAPEVLRRVRSRGCRVALDDFGTGYATLTRLHRLPVDVLKLDRSFLSRITDDVASQALVSLVLGLAGPLRVEVVVEGVETEQQRDALIELGCRRAQGFLFGRPSPGEAIQQLLDDGRLLGAGRPAVPSRAAVLNHR